VRKHEAMNRRALRLLDHEATRPDPPRDQPHGDPRDN
jgi:hypothetical protein